MAIEIIPNIKPFIQGSAQWTFLLTKMLVADVGNEIYRWQVSFIFSHERNFVTNIRKLTLISICQYRRSQQNKDGGNQNIKLSLRSPRTKTAVCGPSTRPFVRNLGSDRPSHGQIRTLDQDYHLKVNEWTVFLPWTVHLMDEFGRWTKKIILRWTIGRIFDSMDGFGRRTINISTRWMEVDEWTGKRMKQTERWTGDPLTIFRGDYIQLTVEV